MQDCVSEAFQVDVSGGRISGRRWTPASLTDHPPIVLLHDSLGCVATWRDFPAQLAIRVGRSVLAYDRLGYGQSSERKSRPSLRFIDEEAETVFPEFCRELGLEEVALFGHSVGGAMAIAIASHNSHTGLCASVITEAAQAFVEHRTTVGIQAAKERFSSPAKLAKLVKYHGTKARWVLAAWTETWLDPKFADWNLDSNLRRIQCPVLAIHGDQDEYGSIKFPHRIATGVSGYSEVLILEGVGHVPHRDAAEDVLDAVSGFLEKVENQ